MSEGLDSILTLSERQVGILQPRPLSTLHVGGGLTVDGEFRAGSIVLQGGTPAVGTGPVVHSPNGQSICLHSDQYAMVSSQGGSHLAGNAHWNGTDWFHMDTAQPHIVAVAGAGQFIVYGGPAGTGPAVNTPKLTVDGVSGNLTVAGALSVAGGMTAASLTTPYINWTSRIVSVVPQTYTMAALPGGTGPAEIGVTGLGAAVLAFHRHGAFAAHFGLDTDNAFKIGGWSLGAASYRLMDERDVTSGVVGSKIVQRTPEGYINANYINSTADIQGVAPVYVAGQGGDNYLRWYPKALVSTVALRTYGYFGAAGVPSGGTINRTTGISHNGAGVTHDGTSIYVQKAGVYLIYARSLSMDNTWDPGRYQEMRIMTSGGNVGGFVTHTPMGGAQGSYVHQYTAVNLGVGGQVYFQQYQNSGYTANYDTGFWDLWWVPQ